jgi:hypothetical protein
MLFILLILPVENEKAIEDFNGITPDTTFYYQSSDLLTMAEIYGEAGRQEYGVSRLRFDVVFPIVYAFTLGLSTSWLLKRLLKRERKWCFLNLIPFFAAFFDLLENLFASIVFSVYPETHNWLLVVTPIFSLLKWIFIGASGLIVFDLLILFLVQKVKNRTQAIA